ncbi:MAG: hypothetical protein DRQ60_00345 [Gammaproteobacteria bacterium]|nr:MAG: hypothetical protein DRQ52_04485 [Gammaproteobacteria bacterium]RLA18119.1 MAG: hypothetical protein DRQ60_00345 [Gammaproteobacteria bacterium]
MEFGEAVEFIVDNWLLFAGVAVVVALLLAIAGGASLGGLAQATPAQVVQMINQENAVVLDLRSEEKFAAEHLAGSKNVTAENYEAAVRKIKKPEQQPVVLVSERGVATAALAKQLKQSGIQRLFELKGGVSGWRDEQLPLEKS